MGKYILKQTATGFNFALKATNGEVIVTSEVYKSKPSCKNGIASVKANAPVAALEDQTIEGFKKEQHVEQANLEDVFIDLTGKALRD